MRLSSEEISAIKETVQAIDKDARIYLFGSRVDDSKKGGDIDLLIFSETLSREDRGMIRCGLWDLIGEQKIDIIIARDTTDPFVRIALDKGILL